MTASTVTILEFLKNRKQTVDWLAVQQVEIEALGHYFSDWPQDPAGFGLTLMGHERSGELHLTADGIVAYHVESAIMKDGQFNVLEDVTRQAHSFDDFVYVYRRFRDMILGTAPHGLLPPNPGGSA